MYESPEHLTELQLLLDDSIDRAGKFLRQSLQMPAKSLSATQLVELLQGIKTVALATVTAQGEPRVAPIGALFYKGQFHIPTVANAARTKMLRNRLGVSLTYAEGADLAIIVHGAGTLIEPKHPDFAALDAMLVEHNGGSVMTWGDGVFIRVAAQMMFTFARYPEQFTG